MGEDRTRIDVPPGKTPASCVFCRRIASDDVIAANELAVAFLDAFPVSPGHTLIVPRRHEVDYFILSDAERGAMCELIARIKEIVDKERAPDGYNLGLNAGAAAGQTVAHAHLHVIPRYSGDVPDPRGGVRWVVPGRAAYWSQGGR